ncbi:rhomboid family intramembrane serine protease [Halobacteriales archaeon SW_7_68_16]|nr:MAG: rhomboid family intramembrane serine protease [Halobacteriales archaeon SW_7_68_16]
MRTCDECGEQIEGMPYECNGCGGAHCSRHQLPENHECPGLDQWNDPRGVFAGGPEAGGTGDGGDSLTARLGIDGITGYFRGNVTYLFLGLMWITFALQLASGFFLTEAQRRALFVVSSQHPEFVWTWFTSIFAHGGFFHIATNSIVIFFFGPTVEDLIGSRSFAGLFLVSGALAGLAQVFATALSGPLIGAALGASGAGLAIMGFLAVIAPNMTVRINFILPVPMWALAGFYAALSVFSTAVGGPGAGGIGHIAHLVGMAIGVTYALYVQDRVGPVETLGFGGGPGGRRRGPF